MLVHFLSSIASKKLNVKKNFKYTENILNNRIGGNLVKKHQTIENILMILTLLLTVKTLNYFRLKSVE
jgi:hypothetical protein